MRYLLMSGLTTRVFDEYDLGYAIETYDMWTQMGFDCVLKTIEDPPKDEMTEVPPLTVWRSQAVVLLRNGYSLVTLLDTLVDAQTQIDVETKPEFPIVEPNA